MRRIFLYFFCLTVFVMTQLMYQSSSLLYIGKFHYRGIISFVKGNQSCGFSSQNISSFFEEGVKNEEASTSDYTCLTFLDNRHSQDSTSLLISDVITEFHAYDITYKLRINPFYCTPRNNLPKVKLFLTCVPQKEYFGNTCSNGKQCDDEREFCQLRSDHEQTICIPKRRYNESCNMYSHCYGNTNCEQTGKQFLCQCKVGYEFINGDCLKVGIALGEVCSHSRQCTGTENATKCVSGVRNARRICSCDPAFIQIGGKCLQHSRRLYEPCESSLQCNRSLGARECKYVEGVKLCYCPDGYDIFRSACLKVGIALGESCLISEQCTGTKNAQQCKYHNDKGEHICHCNPGFLRLGADCLQVNRTLYEDCALDIQCNGTTGLGVCKTVGGRGICVCDSNFIEDKDTLRCLKGKRYLGDPCEIDKQCAEIKGGVMCAENMSCTCKNGYFRIDNQCVKAGLKMFESCKYNIQCTGTPNATKCVTVGDAKICHCSISHIEIEGKCRRGDRKINDTCEIDQQCNGTEHAGVCGENGTCICDAGFLVMNEECIPDIMSLSWIHEKNNQLILVGAGGFLFGIFLSIISCLIVYKRKRKSRDKRLNTDSNTSGDNNYYAYAVHGNFRNVAERQNPPSDFDCDNIGNLYDTAHRIEEQAKENLYDVSEPLSTFRSQHSSEDVYMYNHLHEKERQLCENLYDISEIMHVTSNIDA